jgi:hypothetical protein
MTTALTSIWLPKPFQWVVSARSAEALDAGLKDRETYLRHTAGQVQQAA